ncbi:MAG: hypothetical protein QOE78_3346, partial [Alphaproteobacteria bacterium]|nr:hypothetical protein [Alphaproteobacteria bacterium]
DLSKADEFRKSTEEFWSKMDQKGKQVADRRKLTPTRSGKSTRAAATAPKTKKRSKR